MEPMNARIKAAAWAWYQRGAGSATTLATGRSEAAGSAASAPWRGSLSRFKLEADLLLSSASIDDTSDRLQSLHLLPDSSDPSSCGSDVVCVSTSMLPPPPMSRLNSTGSSTLANTADLAIVMSRSSYGTASWDCGSTLFDSFELVAMSKKLNDAHQLNEGTIEKVCPPAKDAPVGVCGGIDPDEEEEKEGTNTLGLQPLKLTPMGINDSCELDADTVASCALNDCKQSRQAIYDMFCRYETLATPVGSACDDEHIKKLQSSPSNSPSARGSKPYRRRRLHSLSKAFRHHFVQLTRSRSSIPIHHRPHDELCLRQSACLPAKTSPHSHTHHHKTTGGLESPGRRTKAEGCRFEASKCNLRKQYSSDDVDHHHAHHHHHHYHHHHHHYLFRHHSDDSLGLLPVAPLLGADKSLQVAAAGLRASKVSSLLSSRLEGALLDTKRKWGDTNSHVSAFPIESNAFPISQER